MEIEDTGETITPSEQLQEGFTPAPIPPLALDGGPVLEPAPLFLPVIAESLCDQGPCRHRHRLAVATDAERGADGEEHQRPKIGPDGEPIVKHQEPDVIAWNGEMRPGRVIYETESYTPVTITRLCYPSPGVKIELGEDEPICECSLWDPEDPDSEEARARDQRRQVFRAREALAKASSGNKTSADVEDLNFEGSGGSHRLIRGKK